ncbi:hypothetical protein ABH944_002798 [Caballeronia udeis]|uniref:Uncharacterized protein n=1 Tax=Caballeronia udeis TaxID=1232866 RepID=A0ABW8MG83_9BURK
MSIGQIVAVSRDPRRSGLAQWGWPRCGRWTQGRSRGTISAIFLARVAGERTRANLHESARGSAPRQDSERVRLTSPEKVPERQASKVPDFPSCQVRSYE